MLEPARCSFGLIANDHRRNRPNDPRRPQPRPSRCRVLGSSIHWARIGIVGLMASQPDYCPSCGYNAHKDRVIERDGFVVDPSGLCSYDGRTISLTPGQGRLLHTVASGNGRPIKAETILNRISDGESVNLCLVLISQLRKKLRLNKVPCPIQTKHGAGYYWALPA